MDQKLVYEVLESKGTWGFEIDKACPSSVCHGRMFVLMMFFADFYSAENGTCQHLPSTSRHHSFFDADLDGRDGGW